MSCNSTSEVAYDAAQDQELYFEIGTEILVASYLQNTPFGDEQPLGGPDNMTIQSGNYDGGRNLSPLEYQRAKAAAIVRGSRPPIADPVNNAAAVIKAQQNLENTNVNNGQPPPGSSRRENSDSTTINPGDVPRIDNAKPPELNRPR